MPLYEFIHRPTGETQEVHGSMRSPPPEEFTEDGRTWHRVYTAGGKPIIKDAGGVRHLGQTLPISRSLPIRDTSEGTPDTESGHDVVRYADGTMTTPEGEFIIKDKEAAKVAGEATGFKRLED